MEHNYQKVEGQRVGSFNYFDNDGFGYLKEKQKEDHVYLRCKFSKRADLDTACEGRAIIDLVSDVLSVTKPHSCTPDLTEIDILKAKSRMKKAASSSQTSFTVVHRDALENAPPAVRDKIPMSTILSTMKSARRKKWVIFEILLIDFHHLNHICIGFAKEKICFYLAAKWEGENIDLNHHWEFNIARLREKANISNCTMIECDISWLTVAV